VVQSLQRLEELADVESDDESEYSSDGDGHSHSSKGSKGSKMISVSATADAIVLAGEGAGSIRDLKRWVAHRHGVDLSDVSVKFSLLAPSSVVDDDGDDDDGGDDDDDDGGDYGSGGEVGNANIADAAKDASEEKLASSATDQLFAMLPQLSSTSSPAEVATPLAGNMSGYLIKQGGKHKSWKKRWFTIVDDCLYYFEAHTSKRPIGIVPLENLKIQALPGFAEQKHCFEFVSNAKYGGTVKGTKLNTAGQLVQGHHASYKMAAESPEVMEMWIEAIRVAMSPAARVSRANARASTGVGYGLMNVVDSASSELRSVPTRGQYCLTVEGVHATGTKWTGSDFSGHEGVLGRSVLSIGPNIVIDFTVGGAVHRSSSWVGDVVGSTVSAHEYVCPIVGSGGDVAQRTVTLGAVLVHAADGDAEALAAAGARLVIALP